MRSFYKAMQRSYLDLTAEEFADMIAFALSQDDLDELTNSIAEAEIHLRSGLTITGTVKKDVPRVVDITTADGTEWSVRDSAIVAVRIIAYTP